MVTVSRRVRNGIDMLCIVIFSILLVVPASMFLGDFVDSAHHSRIYESGNRFRLELDWPAVTFYLIILAFVLVEEMLVGAWPVFHGQRKNSTRAIIILIAGSAIAASFLLIGGSGSRILRFFIDFFPGLPLAMAWLALPLMFCYVVRSLMLSASRFLHEICIAVPAMLLLLSGTYALAYYQGTGDGETQIVIALTALPITVALIVGTFRDFVMLKIVEPAMDGSKSSVGESS